MYYVHLFSIKNVLHFSSNIITGKHVQFCESLKMQIIIIADKDFTWKEIPFVSVLEANIMSQSGK